MVIRATSRPGRTRTPPKGDPAYSGKRFPSKKTGMRPGTPVLSATDAVLDALPMPALAMTAHGRVANANRRWCEFTGSPADGRKRGTWLATVHADDRKSAAAALAGARDTGTGFERELRLRHRDGAYRWMVVHASPQPAADGGMAYWLVVCTDVHGYRSAQQQLVRSIDLRDDMLNASADCIKLIDPQGRLLHMNRAGCLALGVPEDETRFGMPWLDLLSPEVRVRGQRALGLARAGKSARFPGKSVTGDRHARYWDNLLTPLKDGDGRTTLILCVSRDITAQREVELRLRASSEVDALTGVYNRRAFRARIERLVRKARKRQWQLGLLLIDLDHFKHVNDTLGHPAGDHLLRTLSRRLKACLPAESTLIARLGGDEFVIVLDRVASEQAVVAAAEQVLRQLETPISYTGHLVNGSMSIGGAVFPRDAHGASALMTCADAALNDLKAGGRGGLRMFDARMLKAAERAVEQFERARGIVRRDAVVPYFQPKVTMGDGAVVGLEALLRWRDPEGRLHRPGTVAEAFHDYELATSLGHAMQAGVLAQMVAWRERGLPLLPVSINAAPVEFLRGDYAASLLEKLRRHDIAPTLVEIEVTEHMLLRRGAECVADALRLLKSHGVRVSLDDFGTGQSSFVHLRDYPVDSLKIDAGFVGGMVDNPSNLAIIKAIARLGPLLGVEVIAEGVETEEQRSILLAAGCQLGQGRLFAAAQDARKTAALLLHAARRRRQRGD